MAETILVVDDEEAIRELVRFNLERAGYRALTTADAAGCLRAVEDGTPDLIILDVMLPDMEGYELCRLLRRRTPTPVIFLTARNDELEKVLGLELGADDYVTKPFSPRELVARVRAILRRAGDADRDLETIKAGAFEIDLRSHEARLAGRPLVLTPKEFDLLAYLVRKKGQAVTRDRLLDDLWGSEYFGDSRIVDVHIRHLREKVEGDPSSPRHIKTIRGVGYRFDHL